MSNGPSWSQYAAQFEGHDVPADPRALWDFDVDPAASRDDCSRGCELDVISKGGVNTYSEAPEFLRGVVEFAQADGSGSTYGFWVAEGAPLDSATIVAFGSERGANVVASSLRELLALLTYDGDFSCSDDSPPVRR